MMRLPTMLERRWALMLVPMLQMKRKSKLQLLLLMTYERRQRPTVRWQAPAQSPHPR